MDSDDLYQIPILTEVIESSLPPEQAEDVSILKQKERFSVTLSKGVESISGFEIPQDGPSPDEFITAIEWSDRPKCSNYESYCIGTNSMCTHWFLWRFTADGLEPTENGSIAIAAFMKTGNIHQRDAAILMLEHLWRNETSNHWFIPGIVPFSKSPILTFEAIYNIMECSLEGKEDKRIWREGQPNNIFDLHGDFSLAEPETEDEEIKKVLDFMRSMRIDMPDGMEAIINKMGASNIREMVDLVVARAAEESSGSDDPRTIHPKNIVAESKNISRKEELS